MTDILHQLSNWLLSFADTQWAIAVLGLSSFFESIFFPIPPDPLLIAVGVVQRDIAIFLGVFVALTSVAGAIVGHWLGSWLGRPIIDWMGERPLLDKVLSPDKVDKVERLFDRYGTWTILIAAFTPIPYKVFAITAGILHMNRRNFIIASLVGRGARFVTIGVLIAVYGEEIEAFVSGNFELLAIAVSAISVGLVVAWLVYRRIQTRAPASP